MFNATPSKPSEIVFISSYPPRPCGIATYSKDLIDGIHNKFSSSFSLKVCAIDGNEPQLNYPKEVKYTLNAKDPKDYERLAISLNEDAAVKMIFVQHEFGLFGGSHGDYLMQLIVHLKKPVSITFHTVLPHPDEKMKTLVSAISKICNAVVVMTNSALAILRDEYLIPEEKIAIIPHGTHTIDMKNKTIFKKEQKLENKLILSTFGLLSANKSIETALDAMPRIIEQFPNVLYLIIGKTHPEIVKKEGENYRLFLEGKVVENGIQENVQFVDDYLETPKLLEYLCLTDTYLFTSKDPNQAVSGTFAYAMSSGCPVISTPIPHALEVLDSTTGIIVDFQNPEMLADATIHVLGNKKLRNEMSLNAFHFTRGALWENTSSAHARLFAKHFENDYKLKYDLPAINLEHIKSLTTECGIIQFSKLSDPDIHSGFTLDDNARALIALTMHYALEETSDDLRLIRIYLNFLERCLQPNGTFLNYLDGDGEFHIKNDYTNLEDSNGRAIWALGVLLAHKELLPTEIIDQANSIFQSSIQSCHQFQSPRAIAFAIKGLYNYSKYKNTVQIIGAVDTLAQKLIGKYNDVAEKNWEWFEEYLTYANSSLPEAILYAYLLTDNQRYKTIAHITFEFLLSHMFVGDTINVVSNRGWHQKEETPNKFGEQPIDVSYTIQALDIFYKVFKDEDYIARIETAFSWFLGNNHLNQIIYNPLTGGCFDGLEEHNVNLNQGAESTVCYLTARLAIQNIINNKAKRRTKVLRRRKKLVYSTQWNIPRENIETIKQDVL